MQGTSTVVDIVTSLVLVIFKVNRGLIKLPAPKTRQQPKDAAKKNCFYLYEHFGG